MKKKLFFALTGAFATVALVLTVFTTNASSLQDLRAKANPVAADNYCTPNTGTDCKSGATGNIYPNYKAVPYPSVSELSE